MKLQNRALSLLGLVGVLLAQSSGFLEAQEAVQTKHSLWKVQGKTNSIYLFGSIHFLKKEFYPLPEPIEAAYKESKIVVFETDIEKMNAPENMALLLKAALLPEGETLDTHVSKETYKLVDSYLAESGIPPKSFDAYKPWMAAVMLAQIELAKLGFGPEQGVDIYFHEKAKRDKKKIASLETLESQLNLFSGLTKEEEDLMLSKSIREITRFKTIINDMVDAWKTGDAKKLDELIIKEMLEYPRLYKKFLTDRNEQWVKNLVKQLEGGNDVFVVVGAAHLVGKESVVQLLKDKGFKVEQL